MLERGTARGGLTCRFWHDSEYLLNLTESQIGSFLVSVEEEGLVKDTPYHPDYDGE